MPETQDEIFKKGEANKWFERNAGAISAIRPQNDPVINALDFLGIKPKKALEIGASNGYRLAFLSELYGTKCVAVEPSAEAIADERKKYGGIDFRQGVANSLPIGEGEQFDLVILNYVFHWMDRSNLLKSASEVDRAVQDKCFLAIGDFFPKMPTKVRYQHLKDKGIWTYKQNYADLFLGTNLYKMAFCATGSASKKKFSPCEDEYDRFAVSILQKNLLDNYREWAS